MLKLTNLKSRPVCVGNPLNYRWHRNHPMNYIFLYFPDFQNYEVPRITKSIQTCILKSLFNKTMYKNIGADTAGVALWEVVHVDENQPEDTGQLSLL